MKTNYTDVEGLYAVRGPKKNHFSKTFSEETFQFINLKICMLIIVTLNFIFIFFIINNNDFQGRCRRSPGVPLKKRRFTVYTISRDWII